MNEKFIRRKIKIQSCQFLRKITKHINKPIQHFIMDMIQGLLITGSVCLSTITDTIISDSKKSSKVKRLSRNLSNENLFNQLKEDEWNYYNSITDDDLYIYLDKSDIVNEHQQNSEKNYSVADGSKNHRTDLKGYDTSNFLCKSNDNHPIFLHSVVNDRTKYTQREEERLCIKDIDFHFKNKNRIYVGDAGYSDSNTLKFLEKQNDFFLIRLNIMKGKRKFFCNGNEYSSKELIQLQSTTLTTKRFKSKYLKKYGMAFISKVEGTVSNLNGWYTFIIITFDNGYNPMLFITNLECSSLTSVIKLYRKYMDRWTIENAFKLLKKEYHLENYNFRKFNSVQNFNQLLRLIYNILSLFLIDKNKELKNYIVKRGNRIRTNIKNIFFRLAVGIRNIFNGYYSSFFNYW